jgi:membrane protease YdiL (CAAX protease family)
MLVAFGSPLLNSLYLLHSGPRLSGQMSDLGSLASTVHEIAGLLLVGYILARHGLRFRDLGLQWSLGDVGRGLILTIASLVCYVIGVLVLQGIHYSIYRTLAVGHSARSFFGTPSMFAVVPFVLLNPFFEELIVRAYLMTEIVEITGSAPLAIVVSVGIQAVYHLYYGWLTAVALAFQFFVFGLYYARSRRALPIVVAHAAFDLYGFVRLF